MSKAKLLIVDCHPEVLRWIEKRVGRNENLEVYNATSIQEMDNKFLEVNPDILLIDPYMSVGVCFDKLKEIKENNPNIIVIVFAAVIDDNDRRKFSELEVNFVLEKRLACEKLVQTLDLAYEVTRSKKKMK